MMYLVSESSAFPKTGALAWPSYYYVDYQPSYVLFIRGGEEEEEQAPSPLVNAITDVSDYELYDEQQEKKKFQ